MGLRVEDADGAEFQLHINDDVSWRSLSTWSPADPKQCSLWKNIKRAPLDKDKEALVQFKNTLEPFIGNLVMIQSALETQKTLEVITPSFTFELETYLTQHKDQGTIRVFCLL